MPIDGRIGLEAEARKARSIARLESEGVPWLDHLPVIESVAQSHRRNDQEVARRCLALSVMIASAVERDAALTRSMIEMFEVQQFFSPAESAFQDSAEPPKQAIIDMSWQDEALHVLLWSIGFIPRLCRPDAEIDSDRLAGIVHELAPCQLVNDAQLRPQAELLDEADLIYRYHWAVRPWRRTGIVAPGGLNPSVIRERHRALNWLVMDVAWDDVATDT